MSNMIEHIKYLLNICNNFNLLVPPPKGGDPTFYHTGSYSNDLEIYNKLQKINQSIPTMECKCIYEPRGTHGLEGYRLNNIYNCSFNANSNYYRVYPVIDSLFYETCGPNVFKHYFKLIE